MNFLINICELWVAGANKPPVSGQSDDSGEDALSSIESTLSGLRKMIMNNANFMRRIKTTRNFFPEYKQRYKSRLCAYGCVCVCNVFHSLSGKQRRQHDLTLDILSVEHHHIGTHVQVYAYTILTRIYSSFMHKTSSTYIQMSAQCTHTNGRGSQLKTRFNTKLQISSAIANGLHWI